MSGRLRLSALMMVAGLWATACATSVMNDDGSGPLGGNDGSADAGSDGTNPFPGPQPEAAPPPDRTAPPPDSSMRSDSGAPPPVDATTASDTSAPDQSIPDVMIPEVLPDAAAPDGAIVCDISTLGNIAKYLGECALLGSIGTPCSAGCLPGFCCATICTDSNNNALCLLK